MILLFIGWGVFLPGHSQISKQADVVLTLDTSIKYQQIENFAASDAWACQFIGVWPADKRNKIADLLFSSDTSAIGSPKGIALSAWRFNIGAGSAQQDNGGGIKDEWRRAESFLNKDGSYDWERQPGQIWFVKAAKQRGVRSFIAFVNSPPVQYTINGKAYATDGKSNIDPADYPSFANYLATSIKGIQRLTGVAINYLSPVNEPQWDWSDTKQEGCPYTNTQIAGVVRSIDTALLKERLSTKILITEAGKLDYLTSDSDKPEKGSQIADFFNPQSVNYVGDLTTMSKIIAGHSYFTTSPAKTSYAIRLALAQKVATIPGLKFWQSEYCILGDNAGEMNGEKRDTGMNAALYMASVIHTDLTVAHATAWQWWTSLSPYDYKDGLIYVDKNKTGGNFYESKMLWVLGNYSRFVRPGATRINTAVTNAAHLQEPLLVSAYASGKNISIVVINKNEQPVSVQLGVNNGILKNRRTYTTSETEKLTASHISTDNNPFIIQGRSVVTVTCML